jgi:hypothetical protein
MRYVSAITTPPRFRAPVRVTLIGDEVTVEDADEEQGTATRGRYVYTEEGVLTGDGPLSDSARAHCGNALSNALRPVVPFPGTE